VALLSHRLWQRRFGGDSAVVGQTVELGGELHRVIAVLPAGFRLHLPAEAFLLRDADVWTAARIDRTQLPPRNHTVFTAFARLRPGATFEAAQAELDRMAARLEERHPVHAASGLRARVVPLHADVVKGARPTLVLLSVAVGLVLCVACANVANLLLARGRSREGEIAIRAALGAGRRRIVRLVLLESALLAALGGGAGILLAGAAFGVVRRLGRVSLPRLEAVALDGSVLLFALGVASLAALAAGLVPALRAAVGAPAPLLAAAGRVGGSRREARFRDGLVVAEVALSVLLLVGAGLMIRSFAALQKVDPGFRAEGALAFRLSLPEATFPDDESELLFYRRLEERLSGLPGVASVSAVSHLPLSGSGALMPYAYDAETATRWESFSADRRLVAPGFFHAMGATLLAGRELTWEDVEGEREVVVVDDRLAARAFPGAEAVGRSLQIAPNEAPEAERYAEIVGVVSHLRLHDLARPHLTQIYLPMRGEDQLSVVVRSAVPPARLAQEVRREAEALAPGIALEEPRTMESLVDEALAPARVTLLVMSLFGAVALVMAAVGLYGVLAFAVRQRSREIGIRLALGQAPGEIRWMILGRGMRLVLAATLAGGLAAMALGRFASSLLYGVDATDPVAYLAAIVVSIAAALVACWIPARRATRLDPLQVLRAE
jgi:putative ABC transport system permease protein